MRGYTLTDFSKTPGTPVDALPPHPPKLRLGPSLSPWERAQVVGSTPVVATCLNQAYDALGVRAPVARSIATRPNLEV